MKIFYSS